MAKIRRRRNFLLQSRTGTTCFILLWFFHVVYLLAFAVSRTPPPLEINSDKESSTVLIGDKVKLGKLIQRKKKESKNNGIGGNSWFALVSHFCPPRHVVAVAPRFFLVAFFYIAFFLSFSLSHFFLNSHWSEKEEKGRYWRGLFSTVL